MAHKKTPRAASLLAGSSSVGRGIEPPSSAWRGGRISRQCFQRKLPRGSGIRRSRGQPREHPVAASWIPGCLERPKSPSLGSAKSRETAKTCHYNRYGPRPRQETKNPASAGRLPRGNAQKAPHVGTAKACRAGDDLDPRLPLDESKQIMVPARGGQIMKSPRGRDFRRGQA